MNTGASRREFVQTCIGFGGLASAIGAGGRHGERESDVSISELPDSVLRLMERERVPGLQIAILREGEIVVFESFGVSNSESRDPVSRDTVFEAASLSKPVFAYLVMKLAEDGVLDLDAPLQDIVKPPAEGPPERLKALNAKLVLSHTTGFPNWYSGSKPLTLGRAQGKSFSYSGMAYVYLQRVVEKLTQQPLEILLQQRIFAPLSMTSASLVWRDDYDKRLAYGHGKNRKPVRRRMEQASAASTLVCSAEDYARFAALLLKPPPANEIFLKTKSLKQMLTPRIEAASGVRWGLGLGLEEPRHEPVSFFHWGNNGDVYNNFVVGCPATGKGVVVMTNSGTGLRLCRELIPLVASGDHPALRWKKVVGA